MWRAALRLKEREYTQWLCGTWVDAMGSVFRISHGESSNQLDVYTAPGRLLCNLVLVLGHRIDLVCTVCQVDAKQIVWQMPGRPSVCWRKLSSDVGAELE